MIIHRYMHDGSTINALELMVAKAMYQNANIKLQSSDSVRLEKPSVIPQGFMAAELAELSDSSSGKLIGANDVEAAHVPAMDAGLRPHLDVSLFPDSPEGSVASMGILPAEPSQYVSGHLQAEGRSAWQVPCPESVSKSDSLTSDLIQCTDFAYCDMWMQLHTESRCIVTNDPYCPICMDEHRDNCGECTLHIEQQRERILKGTPVLDLEAWGKDQQ